MNLGVYYNFHHQNSHDLSSFPIMKGSYSRRTKIQQPLTQIKIKTNNSYATINHPSKQYNLKSDIKFNQNMKKLQSLISSHTLRNKLQKNSLKRLKSEPIKNLSEKKRNQNIKVSTIDYCTNKISKKKNKLQQEIAENSQSKKLLAIHKSQQNNENKNNYIFKIENSSKQRQHSISNRTENISENSFQKNLSSNHKKIIKKEGYQKKSNCIHSNFTDQQKQQTTIQTKIVLPLATIKLPRISQNQQLNFNQIKIKKLRKKNQMNNGNFGRNIRFNRALADQFEPISIHKILQTNSDIKTQKQSSEIIKQANPKICEKIKRTKETIKYYPQKQVEDLTFRLEGWLDN